MRSASLLVASLLLLASWGDAQQSFSGGSPGSGGSGIDGYLPPKPADQCKNVIRTQTVTNTVRSTRIQPINIDTTRTAYAQAVVTATMGVTSFMVQTETRQVEVPVTRSYEKIATAVMTVVTTNFVNIPPVTRTNTQTQVVASTQVNERTENRVETRYRTVQVTNTQFNTQFVTSTQVRNVQNTQTITLPAIFSTVIRTEERVQTQTERQRDFSSEATSVVVQTSQRLQYVTPNPIVVTSTQVRTSVSTFVQQDFQTQQAFATFEVTRTSEIFSNRISFETSTSQVFSERVRTEVATRDRVFTSTNIIPQYITSTQVVDRVNQQVVTQTSTEFRVQTQTERGQNQQITQIITMHQNQQRVVTSTINNFQQSTIQSVVTAPCNQVTQAGYNYNSPRQSFNF